MMVPPVIVNNNVFGHLITTEQSANKASRAWQHLTEAGVADRVEIRQGDAFQTLGWRVLYL